MNPPDPGECHVWLVPVCEHADRLDLLDADERRQADRYAVARARNIFVTSRATQRLVGSRYLGVPPAEVATDRDCGHCGARHGRPTFRDHTTVDYSVSHTENWLIMAVTGSGLVGADIESLAVRNTDGLVRAALTAEETQRFGSVPAAARTEWLVTAWTRKEAAMKLTGLGLAAPPHQLDVGGPTVSAGAIPRWPAGPIHLYGLAAPDGHVSALATTVPMVSTRRFELTTWRADR